MALRDFFPGRTNSTRARVEPTIRASSPENPSTSLSNPDAWFQDWAGALGAGFGPPVTERSAMAHTTVNRCVKMKAGILAGLSLKIYRDDPKLGRVEAPDHQFAKFFNVAPFPGRSLTAFNWRELWGVNVELWGNHYSIIRYNQAARVVGFEPVPPQFVEVFRFTSGPRAGQNGYVINWPGGEREAVAWDDMLHIAGMGFDGIKGASVISQFAHNSVSLAKLLEEQTGRSHENASRPSGAVELPPNIKADGIRRMEQWFIEKYTGRMNAGKPIFLDNGSKFTPFSMSAEDLQTIESRKFQHAQICQLFGVPPHLVGEAAGVPTWGAGIEQMTIGFRVYTLDADLKRVESELRLKLFADGPYYPLFDRAELGSLDPVADAAAAQTEIQSGALLVNERRKAKHRPAVEGGDEPLVNATMIPLSRALNPPAPAAPPGATPKPPAQEPKK